jgi:hypothetical protein
MQQSDVTGPTTIAGHVPACFRPGARTLPVSGRRIGVGGYVVFRERPSPKPSNLTLLTDVSAPSRSYPFPVWSGLLTQKHRTAMGPAIWTFLWFLDRVTAEADGLGTVLGGKPVKDREIAQRFGVHKNSVRADRKKLLAGGYIVCKRTPYGFVYRVRNSRKFGLWGKKRVTENCDSRVTENHQLQTRDSQKAVIPESQESVETKKTMQLDHAVRPRPNTGGFEIFWKEYPRKDAKKAAERAFRKIPPTEVPAILASVRGKQQTEQWLNNSGRYIPFASTLLNQERWKDPRSGPAEQHQLIPVRIPTVKDIRVEH